MEEKMTDITAWKTDLKANEEIRCVPVVVTVMAARRLTVMKI